MSNLLKNTRIYLCGSMQYDINARKWREDVTKKLKKINIKVFDPFCRPLSTTNNEDEKARMQMDKWMKAGNYEKVRNRMKKIRNDDLRLCDLSDFVLAYIDPKIPSWGSAEELTTINRQK